MYDKSYWRPPSNFNPTINEESNLSRPYNYQKLVDLGYLPASILTASIHKFEPFNGDLVVKYFKFVEHTFLASSTNALFFPHYGDYRWTIVDSCDFVLRMQLIMTLEGANIYINNSNIDIAPMNRLTIYKSMGECDLY